MIKYYRGSFTPVVVLTQVGLKLWGEGAADLTIRRIQVYTLISVLVLGRSLSLNPDT